MTEHVTSETFEAPEELAAAWLAGFAEAVARCDSAAASSLFADDCHWRDCLAFTWDLQTYSGADRVRAAFDDWLAAPGARDLRLSAEPAPRRTRRAGVTVVEAFFDFETAVGSGRGVLRLLPAPDGQPAVAWTLLTTLQSLSDFPEHVGAHRPRNDDYARNFGGQNWLDRRRAAQEYLHDDPEVLIVGGGQAGMALAARLRQLDVDALVIDRMERVGDNWRQRYHALALHNEAWVCHLPYMPFPPTWPVYLPKDMLALWFEAYAEAMELNFWTSTELVSGEYDADQRRWSVVVRRSGGGERLLRPRHLVLAMGVSGLPNLPAISGLDRFDGPVIHSSGYRDGSAYAGRRALVVGCGNSGHDIAQDLHGHGAEVTMLQRHPTTVVSVEPSAQLFFALYSEGPSTDDCDLLSVSIPYPVLVRSYQLLTERTSALDRELLDGLEAAGFRTDSGSDGTGFHMKYLRQGGGYYLDVGCSGLIIDGAVRVVQNADVVTFDERGAQLRDGGRLDVDVVVLATGYQSMREGTRAFLGSEVADRVGDVWGFDERGDLRNMWRETAQPGLWFMAGSLAQCRTFSRYLALQIKALDAGLVDRSAATARLGRGEVRSRAGREPGG